MHQADFRGLLWPVVTSAIQPAAEESSENFLISARRIAHLYELTKLGHRAKTLSSFVLYQLLQGN